LPSVSLAAFLRRLLARSLLPSRNNQSAEQQEQDDDDDDDDDDEEEEEGGGEGAWGKATAFGSPPLGKEGYKKSTRGTTRHDPGCTESWTPRGGPCRLHESTRF
jgi:hypothetical protein